MTEQPSNDVAADMAEQLRSAIALHQRGQLQEAHAIDEKLLQTNPDHAEALHLLGVIAFQQRQFGNAVVWMGRAIASDPRNPALYANRGLAFQELKQLDAALADYDKAIAIKPDFAQGHNNRGNAHQELRKFDAAIADYDKAALIANLDLVLTVDTATAHLAAALGKPTCCAASPPICRSCRARRARIASAIKEGV